MFRAKAPLSGGANGLRVPEATAASTSDNLNLGGKKKIEIGDAIRFRVEKNHASLLTPEGKEQKLGVVSEGMKEAGNTVPATSQEP